MIITTCGNSERLAKKIAHKLHAKYSPLTLSSFPDGDIYLKFSTELKGKKLVIIQSFQPNPDQSLFDILFAAETAKDLGAKKVVLVAPYLAYMRQDKRFHSGEGISSKVMAKLLNHSVDKIITVDPHLHRYKSLKEIFTIPAVKLSANALLGDYLKKHFHQEIIIGPDAESFQWAQEIAKKIKVHATILKKERYSSRHVEVKMVQPISIKDKNVVLVDDIISTGHTIIEAAKKAKKMGAKSVSALAVHGLFVEKALEKLQKAGVDQIYTTNTISGETAKIDISSLIVEELKR